jgi:hypothetical protein
LFELGLAVVDQALADLLFLLGGKPLQGNEGRRAEHQGEDEDRDQRQAQDLGAKAQIWDHGVWPPMAGNGATVFRLMRKPPVPGDVSQGTSRHQKTRRMAGSLVIGSGSGLL